MTDELSALIAWAADHWDEPPSRMHSSGVEPRSEIGAPRWNEAFRRWMEGVGDWRSVSQKHNAEEALRCSAHPNLKRDLRDCDAPRVTMVRHYYRWPMRVALHRLSERVYPKYCPSFDRVVWLMANNSWRPDIVAELLAAKFPRMGDERFAHGVIRQALRECQRLYATTTPWRALTSRPAESQAA